MDEFNVSLTKAMRFCSSKEVCIADIKLKLANWNTNPDFIEEIINSLVDEKFIDEERYALAFASDKFRFNNWGKIKISYHLSAKKISSQTINIAINEIPNAEYYKTAKKLIISKLNSIKTQDTFKLKNKVLSYMASKGYETDLVFNILNEINNK